jgi:hypothetical protein
MPSVENNDAARIAAPSGPKQRHPLLDAGSQEAFQRAHEMADVNAGDNAIHHMLGVSGGASKFEHVHGTPMVVNENVPLLGTPTPNFGSTGSSKLITKQFDEHFMYWRYEGIWGGSGCVLGDGYQLGILAKPSTKSRPISLGVEAFAQGEALLAVFGGVFRGKVVYNRTYNLLYFYWDFQYVNFPDNGVYSLSSLHNITGTPDDGEALVASGMLQYA